MPRPTINKDGTPLTPSERVKRCRIKKRADREERLHDALQWGELQAIDRRRAAHLTEWLKTGIQPVDYGR